MIPVRHQTPVGVMLITSIDLIPFRVGCALQFVLLSTPKSRMNLALKKFVINHWLKPVAWLVLEHTLASVQIPFATRKI